MAEKTINQISADARRLYTKANEALQRENLDYAIALFCQVLEKEPGFFECRKALRLTQEKKSAGASKGFFKKMLSGAGSSPQIGKAKMTMNKNPADAIAIVEQVLNDDPQNSYAHRIIVDAATALEFPQTAALSLETLVRHSPKDKALVVEYANLVAETGINGKVAEKFLDELIRTTPWDSDLQQAQKNLSAHRTLDEGGYGALEGGGGSYRDILRNKSESVSLEQENRVQKSEDVGERLIGEYEERLEREPNNLKLMRQLAELYTQKKNFTRALEFYGKIKNSEMGGDPTLDRAIAETKVKEFDSRIAEINPFDANHAEAVAKLQAEKLEFQLAECQQRVEKYPTDLVIRFEMGVLYFQAENIGEAIKEFQKAQQNPHKHLPAMIYLAQCYAKRNMNDSAMRTFQNALKEKLVFDEEKKELVYQYGSLLEKMGKKPEANEQFLSIYETDINYRDVAAKVDAFYASQGN